MSRTVTQATVGRLTQVLLACGVLYAALYVILNDVVAASLYEGYDLRCRRPSASCPRRARPRGPFLTAVFPLWPVLMIAFGIGVRRASDGRRALRVTGVCWSRTGSSDCCGLLSR